MMQASSSDSTRSCCSSAAVVDQLECHIMQLAVRINVFGKSVGQSDLE